jgi:hypothetical protein
LNIAISFFAKIRRALLLRGGHPISARHVTTETPITAGSGCSNISGRHAFFAEIVENINPLEGFSGALSRLR